MTCIVAVGDGRNVWMGADGLRHNDQEQTSRLAEPKICMRTVGREKILIGNSGSFLMGQIIRRLWNPPSEIFENADVDFVMWNIRTNLWEFLHQEAHSRLICGDENSLKIQGVIIFGFRGQVWTMDSDGALCKYSNSINYHAIGAGEEFALGSLFTSQFSNNPAGRVQAALDAAAYHLSSIQGPYTILSCE